VYDAGSRPILYWPVAGVGSTFLLDLQAFSSHNHRINAWAVQEETILGIGAINRTSQAAKRFSPRIGSELEATYLEIWGHDVDSWQLGRWTVARAAFLFEDHPDHMAMRQAYRKVVVLEEDPSDNSRIETAIHRVYATRRERWTRLASKLDVPFPEEFTLWRGVRFKHHDYVADVIEAWRADKVSQTMPFAHRTLSSWTLDRKIAEAFTGKNDGVAVVAQIPFSNTLADKWVDDGAYIVPWSHQNEVLVATEEEDSITVLTKKAIVYFEGARYTFSQRQELFNAWDATLG
jgi:hypothetical protein